MRAGKQAPDEVPGGRVDRLRHELEQANYNYFVLDSPAISDAEYDAQMRELRELERLHPELQDPGSPSMRIGGDVAQGFRPRRHPRPMLSLGNAFKHEQLDSWYQRIRNIVPSSFIDFVVEPKIDGLAIALTYLDGNFQVGATRGNGIEGEDVTANLRTIPDIPGDLKGKVIPRSLEVRGEVYMSSDGFERLNERRAEEGLPLFANPRNSAAGSLRQLDPEITRNRPLHLWAYAIGYCDGVDVQSQWQTLELVRSWGFPVNPLVRHIESLDAVKEYCDELSAARDDLPYEIDGVVIKVNPVVLQEELGAVGREPRWAIAFKFPPRQATTLLREIRVNVGRTGAINPYAVLAPVNVGGVVVSQATLHNEADIQRKDIRVGDYVIVHRAGDVIPQVVKPLPERRDGSQQVYHLPELCPSCGTTIVHPRSEAMARCPNPSCPAQRFRWIEHFVSEPAMDIRGLGERLVAQFLECRFIRDPADLYTLAPEQLLSQPGFQEKSVNNLIRSIQRSRRRPLHNVIFALGIRFVGAQTAENLARAFPDLGELMAADIEQLEAVEGIGGKTAESVFAWSAETRNQDFMARLKAAGVTWRQRRAESPLGVLAGKTFLLTGRLESLSRGQAETRLQEMGARIAPGMSKAVDFLVTGADPGSKLARAQKLGAPIRDETWLLQLLDNGSIPDD